MLQITKVKVFDIRLVESRLSWTQFGWNHHAFCSHSRQNSKDNATSIDLSQYPTERIRNFSIIANVDHGKSTLADRLLELTGTIKRGHVTIMRLRSYEKSEEENLVMDRYLLILFGLIERERGITVKAQTATMFYDHKFHGANDIDVQKPPQAQTVANFYLAFESNLTIIPVINKIDQPTADPDRVKAQLKSMFDLDLNDALLTSAKTGQGLEHVLPAVIE
ncbi:hypothetical protein RHGRI_028411 [Rhododendron griersonianum]|uniref:Tr-type G domain-containing protein n=1 Tax=Rhododendron griersonianum TaxID=479676 RepID=A0AAV6IFQ9_9ERIC|nr:hypothetical protein RHGRI_028411 [Rhododendron griersonianum]